MLSFKRGASSENNGPGSFFYHIIFRSIKSKTQKYLAAIFYFYFIFHFYLSFISITIIFHLASNREGIDNPFIALGASICLFV